MFRSRFRILPVRAARGEWQFWPPTPRAVSARRDKTCRRDRKSTRLNSSHVAISYAVFCVKKKDREVQGQHIAREKLLEEGCRRGRDEGHEELGHGAEGGQDGDEIEPNRGEGVCGKAKREM